MALILESWAMELVYQTIHARNAILIALGCLEDLGGEAAHPVAYEALQGAHKALCEAVSEVGHVKAAVLEGVHDD
jgi:hypothetical protein